ncbi:MAG: type II secretion system protein [Rhodocyclales bacterium]|nr:type II secretion system protein [Rhodocyclales bacterium]MBI5786535.1 type II secretion system protein [Rhodocyclales bacterium]
MRIGSARAGNRGFTYVGVLLLVAIVGIALASTATVWHFQVQRDKERELLNIGNEFRLALDRYAAAIPGSGRKFPLRLEDLLLDERMAAKQRHLRRIYRDPMTGRSDWGLVRTADGQIIGVHSLSNEATIKKANFGLKDQSLTGKPTYGQWVFMASNARAAMQARPAGGSTFGGRPQSR